MSNKLTKAQRRAMRREMNSIVFTRQETMDAMTLLNALVLEICATKGDLRDNPALLAWARVELRKLVAVQVELETPELPAQLVMTQMYESARQVWIEAQRYEAECDKG